jgi:plasmid stability protein
MLMPVNFTIRNVPDELADKIRVRARSAHRSLQGELLQILEEAAGEQGLLTPQMVREKVAAYGIGIGKDESVELIREDRDAR